jgi:hypothetical protein
MPWAAPNQSLSTGLPRRHVGCLVLCLPACFGDFCTPHWAHFTGGLLTPHPCGLKLCLHSLFWGFSFHPAAILQAGCFPQPPGFSHGWHAWSCAHAAGFITAVHLFPCCRSTTHPVQQNLDACTYFLLFCEPGCNQVIWSNPSSKHMDATRLHGCNQTTWLHPSGFVLNSWMHPDNVVASTPFFI